MAGVAEQVVESFRRLIVAGSIDANATIAEAAWAARLQVSRVPVREALVQLERDGLIRFDRRGRAAVRTLVRRDLREILSLRLALEGLGAAEAAAADLSQWRTAIEANLAEGVAAKSLPEMARIDVEFHELIVRASGHQRLIDAWAGLRWPYLALLMKIYSGDPRRRISEVHASLNRHKKIFAAIARQDANAAESLMKQHIAEWDDWQTEIQQYLSE